MWHPLKFAESAVFAKPSPTYLPPLFTMAVKSIFLIACLLLLGSTEATAGAPTKDLFQLIKETVHQKAHDDPEKCKEATEQLDSPQFKSCRDIFLSATAHRASPAQVSQFCGKDNCSYLLSHVFQTIMADCGIPALTATYTYVVLLRETCDRIGETRNTTCLETLPALMSEDSLNENYKNCLISFTDNKCPDICKTAEHWVTETMGCCYRAIADYLLWDDDEGSEVVMPTAYWTMCGMKEPSRCTPP